MNADETPIKQEFLFALICVHLRPNYEAHVLSLALALVSALAAQPKRSVHFDLTAISRSTLYSEAAGFGYEKAAAGEPPYYFSVRVPEEGNYRVTVRLGAPNAATTTTIKAELRRLMVERRNPATTSRARSS